MYYSRHPLEVLAEARKMLKEKNLQDEIELYVDGGIRRGSDIVRVFCLEERRVGIGGLSVQWQATVKKVLQGLSKFCKLK